MKTLSRRSAMAKSDRTASGRMVMKFTTGEAMGSICNFLY
jgi:hypothetical protein